MVGLILLGLLGIGAAATLVADLVDDGDDGRPAPSPPGEEEPETGGPGPLPEDPGTSGATSGDDLITGSAEADTILALAGNDIVRGGESGDTIGGGAGDDRVFGEAGEDVITGQSGDDFLRGGSGDDLIFDTEGADTLRGDTGDDVILSAGLYDAGALLATILQTPVDAEPDDSLLADLVSFDASQDTDTEGDVVDGGAGDDDLLLGQNDTATGGSGSDTLTVGDWVRGGPPVLITDFALSEDILVVSYDSTASTDTPLLTEDDDGRTMVSLGGDPLVVLQGLDFQDVQNSGGDFLMIVDRAGAPAVI